MNLEELGWGEPFASAFAAPTRRRHARARGRRPSRPPGGGRPAGGVVRRRRRPGAPSTRPSATGSSSTITAWSTRGCRAAACWPVPSRNWPPTSTSPSSSPRPTATSTPAASSAWWPSPPAAAATVLVLNKADLVIDLEPTLAVVRGAAPGVPDRRRQRAPRRRRRRDRRAPRPRAHGRPARVVGGGEVDARSTRCSAATTRPPRRSAPSTTAGATRRRTARCSSSPMAAAC